MLVPLSGTRAYLARDGEIPGALRWAAHHGIHIEWDESRLELRVWLVGQSAVRGATEDYLLLGSFDDFPVLPPNWRFLDPRTELVVGRAAYPEPNMPQGSIFHPQGLICAPWSRASYAEFRGPHQDWTEPAKWRIVAPRNTQAPAIPDMLARIAAEVAASRGRMAPLPPVPAAAA